MEKFQIVGKPTCQIMYVDGLFTKRKPKGVTDENAKAKYNATILIPKSDTAKVEQLDAEFEKAFADYKSKGGTAKTSAVLQKDKNCPYKDGDAMADEKDGLEHLRGYKVLRFSSERFRPDVVDTEYKVINNGHMGLTVDTPADKVSALHIEDGDYILANVSFWTYVNKFEGIGCNCHAIVRIKQGTPVGGGGQGKAEDLIKIEEDYV